MRVRAALGLVATLGFALVASRADAQSLLHRPAAPSAGVSGLADVRYQRVDLGESDLHAGQLGLEIEGRALLHPQLELGARWGVRASLVVLDDFGDRARMGLPPLTIFVGTGGQVDEVVSLGLRLMTGASFALLGVDDLSSNGEHAFAALEGALAARWPAVSLEARVALGVAYAGSTAVSGILRAGAGADFGETTWLLRPYLGATLAFATDMDLGAELLVGATALIDDAPIRFGVGFSPWHDPSANVVRVWLAINAPIDGGRP